MNKTFLSVILSTLFLMCSVQSFANVYSIANADSSSVTIVSDTQSHFDNDYIERNDNLTYAQTFQITQTITQVIAITVPFVCIIIAIWLVLHFRNKTLRDKLKVVETSIVHGQQLPPEFFGGGSLNKDDKLLQTGIYWIGSGLAIILFFIIAGAEEVASLGIIPLFIGISRCVVYYVKRLNSKKHASNSDAQQD